jgi:hypothetical protein
MVPPDIPETLRMSKFPTSVDLPNSAAMAAWFLVIE